MDKKERSQPLPVEHQDDEQGWLAVMAEANAQVECSVPAALAALTIQWKRLTQKSG